MSINSGLDDIELMDVIVSRLSLLLGERLEGAGAAEASLFPERPLDSQEKLMPSFFGAGSAADDVASLAFEAGEEAQGMEGKLPDSPLVLGGIFICNEGVAASSPLSSRLRMSDEEALERVSVASSSPWMSVNDDDGPCAVSRGDFGGASDAARLSSAFAASTSGFGTIASEGDMILEPLGVDVAEDGPPSMTDEGISSEDFENGRAGGRGVVSGASREISWAFVSE